MRILVIDNNLDQDCWGAADLARFAAKKEGATVVVRRGPHRDLPRDISKIDRIVISGSRALCTERHEWAGDVDELIRRALNEKKPILGVCYGHQAIARTLGGSQAVRLAAVPEYGWSELEQVQSSSLLSGLPEKFHSFSSHCEEVATLPRGAKHLVRSKDCEIQGFQLENQPVFGIQFHPEKDLAGARKSFEGWKKSGRKNLLHPTGSEKIFDLRVGETIFMNFFGLDQ